MLAGRLRIPLIPNRIRHPIPILSGLRRWIENTIRENIER